ncbi:unnamed protein product [Paramecium pentaurelia]|uniref:Alpha-type protein kinase domain-containing protein n=1 Tax=Paramecium pentaurelia TaxID=43138 RepID=A0A8S1VK88_9CILI|nr:unnamed protein product [Paramecium pentaurelia]
MNTIVIRYPDGNIYSFEMQNGEVLSLRKIFLNHAQNLPPLEVTILINENTNTLVSRDETLKTNVPYKLVDCREMIKCFNNLRDCINQKDKQLLEYQQTIKEKQQLLDSYEKQIGDQEKQRLNDIQHQYRDLESNFKLELEKNKYLQKENETIKQDNILQKQKKKKVKKQIDDLNQQIQALQKNINQGQNSQKQLEEKNNNLKNKYLQYKEKLNQMAQEKSAVESKFSCLGQEIQFKQEKIIEKENLIKFQEEQHQKKLEQQSKQFGLKKINLKNQIKIEQERLKEVEQKYQIALQENSALRLNQSSNDLSNRSQLFQQKDLEMEIQQQKLNFEKQINHKDDQIILLKSQNDIKDMMIQDLKLNLEQINKESNQQKQQLQNYKQQLQQLERQIEEQKCQIKNLNSIIEMADQEFIKKNEQNGQNQDDILDNYNYRLRRLVEQIPRFYKEEINFAIEDMFQKKLYEKKGNCINQTFQVYQLTNKNTRDIIFTQSNLDVKQTIIKSYKQNIHGELSKEKIVSEKKYSDKSRLIDSIQLYYSKSIDTLNDEYIKVKSENSNKIYMIKETFTNQQNNIGDIDYTLHLLSRSIVAQMILDEFVAELKNKNINIPFKFQFVQPILFSIKIHFKKYFSDLIAKQGEKQYTNAFKTVISFMDIIEEQYSNDFYEYIRELQLTRLEVKSQDGKITNESNKEDQTQFILKFINICYEDKKRDPFKNILQQFNLCSNEEKLKAFIDLTELLSETYNTFPTEKFFYGYELNLKDINDKSVFKKYNGGNINFDSSEEGKFFSALSFYSILKTEQQFCVSHIQGIGNYLYDPVVSTYDGFLDCLDQGINEIRNIESAFSSSDTKNIGFKYIEALGSKYLEAMNMNEY